MRNQSPIDLNKKFLQALEWIEKSDQNIFVTGRAGTGKSTLLRYFREHTKKNIAVLAPTGVAAVNIRGQTIHSFFRFKPDITVSKIQKKYRKIKNGDLYKKLDAIVIDEISMVRADLLDCVDAFLRLHGKQKQTPFGGIQMIFIGDLYQLPPVVPAAEKEIFQAHYASPYFFDAHGFKQAPFQFIELEKIYRQSDPAFIEILNGIRNRSVTDGQLEKLNSRHQPHFKRSQNGFYIHLTTTNAKAKQINLEEMAKRKGKVFEYEGRIRGEFDEKAFPTELHLKLKIGAQVMLVNNDSFGRWINGTVGEIMGVEYDEEIEGDVILVKLAGGDVVDVSPNTWEMFRFRYDTAKKSIESETTGSFTQYPIMLAWAITIHKSQGKTFERTIIDLERGTFAHGQTYVALSRCTSLEGMILTTPIKKGHILMDWRVVKFLTQFQYQLAEKEISLDEKINRIQEAVKNRQKLKITYLKTNDEKTEREILPEYIGELTYEGRKFLGVEGYCFKRKDTRVFRVDRILNLRL